MLNRFKTLFQLGDDAASEKEIISFIEKGVNFRGAKLWILIIAVFVASLGLNTNSAAVIIGAMLISPLMGPIIGIGLGVGIYDFDLVRRSWRNYIIATIFSILTATVYFLITPFNVAQSELLARTSPTIYDVLIALCGGLAGIIAMSSLSQRSGNVIPGVAIATALMPPLCTVGFGLATGNWTYAAGAFYLFLINSIFIALATFVGAMFIMKFEKKASVEQDKDKKVKRFVYFIAGITILPALILTISMVQENNFKQRVSQFIEYELSFPMTHVISYDSNFKEKTFNVVLIGSTVDSLKLKEVREHLPEYNLQDVKMTVIQDHLSNSSELLLKTLSEDRREQNHAEKVITEQQYRLEQLEHKLQPFEQLEELTPQLIRELKILYPSVNEISSARGITATTDSTYEQTLFIISVENPLGKDTEQKLTDWLIQRTGDEKIQILFK